MPSLQTSYNATTKTARVASGGALPNGFVSVGVFDHPDPVYPGSVVAFHAVRDLLYKRSKDNPAVTASFPKNINDMENVKIDVIVPTGITLTAAGGNLAVNATRQSVATLAPVGAISPGLVYKTSDATKATVSATGLITGKAAGAVTISVETIDQKVRGTVVITVA